MSFIAVAIGGSALIGAGASIFGGYEQSQAEKQAASTVESGVTAGTSALTQALSSATSSIGGYANKGISAIQQLLGPYANIGSAGGGGGTLQTLLSLLTPGGSAAALSSIPGYNWLQQQTQMGVSAQGTTRGLGGNQLAAGATYGNGVAQQGYSTILNSLQSLLSTGSSAAGSAASGIGNLLGTAGTTIGNLTSNIGTGISNLISGGASQVAQTQVGGANAVAGAATGAANSASGATSALTNYNLLQSLINRGATPAATAWAGATGAPAVPYIGTPYSAG